MSTVSQRRTSFGAFLDRVETGYRIPASTCVICDIVCVTCVTFTGKAYTIAHSSFFVNLKKKIKSEFQLIKGTILFLLGLLLVLKEPHYLANGLLVIAPIILTYLGPSDRPETGIMFIYWTIFGFFYLFDRILEYIPLYYIIKLAVFIGLFLPPSNPTIELIHKKVFNIQ